LEQTADSHIPLYELDFHFQIGIEYRRLLYSNYEDFIAEVAGENNEELWSLIWQGNINSNCSNFTRNNYQQYYKVSEYVAVCNNDKVFSSSFLS
jgi:hypothetical protein